MAKEKELTAAKRQRLLELTAGFRGIVIFLFVISGIINILALTGSIYMMQIYDRALTSGSVPTLVVLSTLAIGLYLFQGSFDVIRSQILIRVGARLDTKVAPLAHRVAIDMPRYGFSSSEALDRAASYAEAGADGVMVEAIRDLETLAKLRSFVSVPIMVNQLHGGKSPNWRFDELEDAGASILICSTPCLFAAQHGIERYLDLMLEENRLPSQHTSTMADCARVLNGTNGADRQSRPVEAPREVVTAKTKVFA